MNAAEPERPRRAQVMSLLRASDRPLGVAEIAESLGVHTNTVRFHLDALVADGAIERTLKEPDGPGRPRTVYSPNPGMDRGGARNYQLLSRVLLSQLAAEGSAAADGAREAGRAWGRHLIASPAPFQRLTSGEAVAELSGLLADLGFEPESGSEELLRLRHCPFLELAEEYGAVVCPLHLGLMQGALDELGAPVAASGLEPFGEPDACLVHLEPSR